MSASSVPPLARSSEETKAQLCLLLNVAATPGLGSLVGRCWIVGSLQLLMASAGFVLIMMWFYEFFVSMINQGVIPTSPISWLWQTGLVLVGAAWTWGLMTGLSKVRAARLRGVITKL